jgi:hypothetical protein
MDELKGAAKWAVDEVALAKERDKLRIADTLAQFDELDERAREHIRLRTDKPGYSWKEEAQQHRLRMIGLAITIGDPELEQAVEAISEAGDPPGDESYKALVRRLAALRRMVFETP